MGVINNLIKIRDIIGKNWDGTTLADILRVYPIPRFINQPANTSAQSVTFSTNMHGFYYRLQRQLPNGNWEDVGTQNSTAYTSVSASLSAITTTTVCRVDVFPNGSNYAFHLYSNQFTVTRDASAQTTSAKETNKLDLNADETAVETDVIKKEDKE